MLVHIFLFVCTARNFLVRKQCCDGDVFGNCDCRDVKFDVLLIDYDYVHKEGTQIQDAIHTGTYQYRALPLLVCMHIICSLYVSQLFILFYKCLCSYVCICTQFPCDSNMIVKAERLYDHYSLCIMIISIICGNEWCEIKLV